MIARVASVPLALALVLGAAAGRGAGAPEALPEPVGKAFAETEDGVPVVPEALQRSFRTLPGRLQQRFADKMRADMIGGAEHVRWLLEQRLAGEDLEFVLADNCILCHSNPEKQSKATLFSPAPASPRARALLDLKGILQDVHSRRGLSCAGCHGGSPDDLDMTDAIYDHWPGEEERASSRAWIPQFCGGCHSDPAFIRRFAPKLPTDQLDKYRTSRHGELVLRRGDSDAAQCESCHGAHGVLPAADPGSKVFVKNVPATCGRCHSDPRRMSGYRVRGEPIPTDQVALYEKSVHGRALLERDDRGAPVCNDCHGNHASISPEATSVGRVCRTCHPAEPELFDASPHREPFRRHGWPECEQCHGKHDIADATDELLAGGPGTLCHDCHAEHAQDNAEALRVPAHMRERLEALVGATVRLERSSRSLAERGLDVGPLEAEIAGIGDALTETRTRVHAFDRDAFDETANQARDAVAGADSIAAGLRRDFRFRRNGLFVAIGIMGLVATALALRLRELERP